MIFVTGSSALKNYFGNSFWREMKDEDYLISQERYDFVKKVYKDNKSFIMETATKRGYTMFVNGSKPVEFEICEPGTTGYEFIQIRNEISQYPKKSIPFLTPFEVGMFKYTHRFLKNSPHFKKTMDDLIMLKSKGWMHDKSIFYADWIKKREKETYDYSHPNLNVKKNDFFRKDTGIDYIYDHDSIHVSVALGERPAYFKYLADGAAIKTSKEKFNSLPLEKQLHGPLEESYVLALERHQIPNGFKPDRRKSFEIGLMKVCTSVTSGWFREFAYSNYYDILKLYDENYVDKFHIALDNGVIKPFTGTM